MKILRADSMGMLPRRSGYCERKTARIYYEVYGEGPPLCLLHGNGEDLHYFDNQIAFFSPNYNVIAIDCRGRGKSTFEAEKLSIELMAEDVVAVLDLLGISSAHMLGFSDGGNIALYMALHFPGRLRSLMLVGANLSPKGVKLSAQIPIVLGYSLCVLIAMVDKRAEQSRQILGLMVREPDFSPAQLIAIKVPTLVIAGEKDIIRRKHTELIHRSIAGSKLMIITGADHFLPSKKPEEFNAVVAGFLSEISGESISKAI